MFKKKPPEKPEVFSYYEINLLYNDKFPGYINCPTTYSYHVGSSGQIRAVDRKRLMSTYFNRSRLHNLASEIINRNLRYSFEAVI